MTPSLFVSTREAAKLLGVGHSTIYKFIREDRLRSVKIGGRRLIARAELERLAAMATEDVEQ